jgi:hypothetical protein
VVGQEKERRGGSDMSKKNLSDIEGSKGGPEGQASSKVSQIRSNQFFAKFHANSPTTA